MVRNKNSFKTNETAILVNCFTNDTDTAIFVGIIRNQPISNNELNIIYNRYKKKNEGINHICDELISYTNTPIDIIKDIAEHNVRYPNQIKYPEHLIKDAQETLNKRESNNKNNFNK
ncbi:MAG: hypothetical protein PF692_08080 [Kiritimatiellae bacterium]|jgi:hypothetical protein|nr:hypothetical protein [Kiritimatiellia bacterium]